MNKKNTNKTPSKPHFIIKHKMNIKNELKLKNKPI